MTSGDMLVDEPGLVELQDPTFLMYSYKVKPCQKKYRHDWRVCPFAHEGESAARRDPRKHKYVGVACPYAKQGKSCPRGQSCPCTHNVFEYWLHPTRFRTEICSQGTKCNRSCCFFAHTDSELRKLKHHDIINSAVGDPNETCSALESYLRKTSTCELNDIEDESDSHDSGDDAVIIMGSVPKVEDDASSLGDDEEVVVGMAPEAEALVNTSVRGSAAYSPSEVVLRMGRTSPGPVLQSSRAYLNSPELVFGQAPEGLLMDHNIPRYPRMSPQREIPTGRRKMQDIYMASPEPGILLGPDGQSHLVNIGAQHQQVQDFANSTFNAYSRAAAPSSSPYGAQIPVTHPTSGVHQNGRYMAMQSPTPTSSMLDRDMGGRMSSDNLAGSKSDYDLLSRSWRMNRGVSFPAALHRPSGLGSATNLQASPGVHHAGSPGSQPASGNLMNDDSPALRSEFQKLSASWGINRGVTLPALHQTPAHQDTSFLLQKEHEKLSASWGINRGVSNPVNLTSGLNLLSGLDGVQTNPMENLRNLDMSYQSDLESLVALQSNPQVEDYTRHVSPLPGEHAGVALPSDAHRMASSWGLAKNVSSLSDSFALGGQERYDSMNGQGVGAGKSIAPPPGFGAGRPSFDLTEKSQGNDWSFAGRDGMGSYVPSGKVLGRNWTFGGNGRVV